MDQQNHQSVAFGALHGLDVGRAQRSCFQYEVVIFGGENVINSGQLLTPTLKPFQVLKILLHFRIGRLFGFLFQLMPTGMRGIIRHLQQLVKFVFLMRCQTHIERPKVTGVDRAASLTRGPLQR